MPDVVIVEEIPIIPFILFYSNFKPETLNFRLILIIVQKLGF